MKKYIYGEDVSVHIPGKNPLAQFKAYPGHIFDNGMGEDSANEKVAVLEFLSEGDCRNMLKNLTEESSELEIFNAAAASEAIRAFEALRKQSRDRQDAPAEGSRIILDL